MTPAERLLAAADLLDKRAGEATEGPWSVPTGPRYVFLDGFSGHDVDGPKGGFVARGSYWADATYIATMHPEVGKKQAAMLRAFAAAMEREWRIFHEMWKPEQRVRMLNDRMPGLVEALDLADLILASAS